MATPDTPTCGYLETVTAEAAVDAKGRTTTTFIPYCRRQGRCFLAETEMLRTRTTIKVTPEEAAAYEQAAIDAGQWYCKWAQKQPKKR